ncbi:uncharacterized protein LOC143502741 [Brachyhypopomus gauderio]
MDRFPAVVVEGDFRVQNLQHLLPHIVSSERVTESGQGEGQGHAPTVSAGRDTEIRQLGFPNIGNTCYMNATLQCLLSLSCFWSPIRAQCSSWTDPSSCQMLRCFADLQQGRLTSRSSSKKKKLLRALNACISVRCPAFGEDYEQSRSNAVPIVLILHIKRFDMLGKKLTNLMDIPSELDLSVLPGVASLGQPLRSACTTA